MCLPTIGLVDSCQQSIWETSAHGMLQALALVTEKQQVVGQITDKTPPYRQSRDVFFSPSGRSEWSAQGVDAM